MTAARPTPATRRTRAFTLLETLFAALIGSFVLAAALGLLVTVQRSDLALADHAEGMNDLAVTQTVLRRALDDILAAPPNTVRDHFDSPGNDVLGPILRSPFPEPIAGLPARIELLAGERPRLELVLRRPLFAGPASANAPTRDAPAEDPDAPADPDAPKPVLGVDRLIGHRGAFELRPQTDRPGAALWWIPMPPPEVPERVTFVGTGLPAPTRLCRDVSLLRWTAFIDSTRTPQIRAIEAQQFPAYLELEIATVGGGYGNWTFELAWTSGDEIDLPPEPEQAAPAAETDPQAPDAALENQLFDAVRPGPAQPEINP
jgi:hypothetical protein